MIRGITMNNKLVEEIFNFLKQKKLTISFCESASAGALTSMFCEIEGISLVYKGSIICYSNDIKKRVVKISENILQKYGVVSSEVAKLMAKNTAEIMETDICISITGNAGKNVIENKKPCLYYICIYMIDKPENFEITLEDKERNFNRINIAYNALLKLKELLK